MTRNILVVEDEKPLAVAIEKTLTKRGFQAIIAQTASVGLEEIKKHNSVDAIWLDHYLLYEENGLDLMYEIKKNKKWADIPVFVVSNSVGPDKIKTYELMGIEAYYVKAETRLEDVIEDINITLEKRKK